MSRTVPLARWVASSFVLATVLILCAGRVNTAMKTYLLIFAGMGLGTVLVTDASQDGERRKPGPEEMHPNSRRGATALFLATVFAAALDVGRFHWMQPVSLITQALALVLVIFAAGLQVWAMASNSFFSTAIRIQTGRGHQLITRGPYRIIRHPGYLAMIITMPETALALGSLVALIPAFGYSALILWRTNREDEFLTERLAGYTAYSQRVRYRLIPRLW